MLGGDPVPIGCQGFRNGEFVLVEEDDGDDAEDEAAVIERLTRDGATEIVEEIVDYDDDGWGQPRAALFQ